MIGGGGDKNDGNVPQTNTYKTMINLDEDASAAMDITEDIEHGSVVKVYADGVSVDMNRIREAAKKYLN